MRAHLGLFLVTGLVLAMVVQADGESVFGGSGLAQFTHPPGAPQQCTDIQAALEWHPRISNENVLNVRFAGGQGSPATLCVPGWGFAFMPDEVQGQPSDGLHAYRTSPDATIWLTMSPPNAQHLYHLHVYQVSTPPLTDQEQFDGDLSLVV